MTGVQSIIEDVIALRIITDYYCFVTGVFDLQQH